MDVTRTVRFEGSVDEFMALQRMLEEEGVRVELPLWVRDRVQQQEQRRRALDGLEQQLRYLGRQWERLFEEAEAEESESQLQLRGRQAHEVEDLQRRHERELQELKQRHEREQREQDQNYQRRRNRRDSDADIAREQYQFQNHLVTILADINEVVVSLVSTGATLAIAEAVKKFRRRHPDSKVEVEEHKDEAEAEKKN